MLSPASCCRRRPRWPSASAAPAPPPPGPCTAGSCLWPLRCLLEWEQGKDGPSGLEHQGAGCPKAAARAPPPRPWCWPHSWPLGGACVRAAAAWWPILSSQRWPGPRSNTWQPMAETLLEARWRKQAPPQATLACWPHTHPTAGARVKAEEPQATPGHGLLEGCLWGVPAAQSPARSAKLPGRSQAALPAVSASSSPGLSEGAPPPNPTLGQPAALCPPPAPGRGLLLDCYRPMTTPP